jgi:short-subunit dehydrogenase
MKNYSHIICDVSSAEYRTQLLSALGRVSKVDLCIYFAGIGDHFDWKNLEFETKVFEVNLMGAVVTTEVVLNKMLKQNSGHFIGLSSLADMIISPESPSYSASKSAVSRYWEGLGIAAKNLNIKISNIRFGFVNTKMAKSPIKPFMLSVDEAVSFIFEVIQNPRVRASKPIAIIPFLYLVSIYQRFRLLLS